MITPNEREEPSEACRSCDKTTSLCQSSFRKPYNAQSRQCHSIHQVPGRRGGHETIGRPGKPATGGPQRRRQHGFQFIVGDQFRGHVEHLGTLHRHIVQNKNIYWTRRLRLVASFSRLGRCFCFVCQGALHDHILECSRLEADLIEGISHVIQLRHVIQLGLERDRTFSGINLKRSWCRDTRACS
jgi:hypothetical protein